MKWTTSQCESCRWMRPIHSGRGSRFLLCRRSVEDAKFSHFPKYPPQPQAKCPGFEPLAEGPPATDGTVDPA